MAVDPLTSATRKWNRQQAAARSAGYSNPAIQSVKQLDLKKVSSGGTSMSGQMAQAAMESASTGKLATTKQPGTGVTSLPGNFFKDIGGMARGVGVGIAHLISHPGRDIAGIPKGFAETGKEIGAFKGAVKGNAGAQSYLQQHGYEVPKGGGKKEPVSDLGTLLRDLGKTPVGKFAPGVETLGQIFGGKPGQQQIEAHPAAAVMDVSLVAGQVGKLAQLGDLAPGSASESFAKGEVGRTTLRAAAKAIERISGGKYRPQAALHEVLSGAQMLQSQSQDAARAFESAKGVYFRDVKPGGTGELLPEAKTEMFNRDIVSDPVFKNLGQPPITYGMGFEPEPYSTQQQALIDTFNNATPHNLSLLPKDQRDLVVRSYTRQSHLTLYGQFAHERRFLTYEDFASHAERLPPNLREQFFHDHIPANTDHMSWHPDFNGVEFMVQRDLGNLLYGTYRESANGVGTYGKHGLFSWNPDEIGPGPLPSAMRGVNKVFKTSIIMRPATLANIFIGNMIRMTGESGPELLTNVKRGIELGRSDNPVVLAGGLKSMSTDQVYQTMAGRTAGRLLNSIKGAELRLVDHLAQMQRGITYITEHDKAVRAGLPEDAALQAGMEAQRRVYMSLGSMTPVEQAIVKQIFPFYGYQKLLWNYLAKFPANHPFVTEMMGKIAAQENDLSTGLPQTFQSMLSLGAPDQNGNVKKISVTALSPFQSLANDFTIAGFMTAINPIGRVALEHLGVTPRGHPELYPQLSVDPSTGSLVGSNPNAGGLMGTAEAVVPELRTVDSMLGFNNRLKSLKVSNPSAYRAVLMQGLGIPIPQTVNVPSEIARHEGNMFKVAQQNVSSFLKTGDTSYITGWNQVPFSGRWWTPQQLAEWYQTQKAAVSTLEQQSQATGSATSLKALLPRLPRPTQPQAPLAG